TRVVTPRPIELERRGGSQLLRRPGRNDSARVQVCEPPAGCRLLQVARAEDDERTAGRALEQRPDLGARYHVDSGRRLVEQEEGGLGKESVDHRELHL